MTRYEDHGVRPGREVIQLKWWHDGENTALYRYDTAAAQHRAHLEEQDLVVEQTRVPWDGLEYVSTDNGD